MVRMNSTSRRVALASLPLALVLASCGDSSEDSAGSTAGGAADGERLSVVASFYPLQFLTERVAGDLAEVSTLTAPGVEPHDLELSPRQVGELGSADLVVVEHGMQPAVDDAVEQQKPKHLLDVSTAADLEALAEEGHDHEHEDDHAATDDDHGGVDPHFWLDPVRSAKVGDAIAEELATVDPANAETYRKNAEALHADLDTLDKELSEGLKTCTSREVVTTHEAFGYLGHKYDLRMHGVTGISPESEPSATRLAEVADLVRELEVKAVFTEPLLPKNIAETVATETGTKVLPLDPAEGVTDATAKDGYLGIMRANLTSLREGLGCE